MALDDLTLDRWRSLDLTAAQRVARDVADRADGRLTGVETVQHLGAPLHRALIERGGQEFALIPGGTARLGFDLDTWQPTAEQLADYSASLNLGYGFTPDLKAFLTGRLSPVRTVSLAPILMAVVDEPLTELPAHLPEALATRGLRLPSSDEWEHACGAGTTTLFRWGDDCPLDDIPYGAAEGPHLATNAFGLRIAHDPYSAELSSDAAAVHGGDGGEAVCGGYGNLLAWLPLATANRNPALAELAYGPEAEDTWDSFSTRPVIELT